MDISKDLIAASVTPLVLAILKNQDSYGYEIIKKIKKASDNKIIWSEGMLYPVLHRLEDKGFIESYWKQSKTGRRRKYYYLKEEGLKELKRCRRQWEVVHSTLFEEIYYTEQENENGGK